MQHTLQCLVRVAHYGSKSFEYVHPNLQSSLAIKFLYTNWDLEKKTFLCTPTVVWKEQHSCRIQKGLNLGEMFSPDTR